MPTTRTNVVTLELIRGNVTRIKKVMEVIRAIMKQLMEKLVKQSLLLTAMTYSMPSKTLVILMTGRA
jgi:hypothetical protein